ncbi:MAG: YfhO family protein [Blastocatellia bacterium]|nr:YfhO family protein [Blastocatellia bacterium]
MKLRDLYDPNWVAEVDGVPAAIVPAESVFRCVRIAQGLHEVRFVYRPRALTIGLMLSIFGLVVIGGLLFAPSVQPGSRRPTDHERGFPSHRI